MVHVYVYVVTVNAMGVPVILKRRVKLEDGRVPLARIRESLNGLSGNPMVIFEGDDFVQQAASAVATSDVETI